MISWENLTEAQKQAVKAISSHSLLHFTQCFFQILMGEKLKINWHHKYISRIIEDIIDGKRSHTIINVAPGSTKTEFASIHAPIYSYVKKGKVRNMNLSFSDNLVRRNANRAKNIVKSEEFQYLYPSKFGKSKEDEWQVVDEKGKIKLEIISKSIGGEVTGGRAGYTTDYFSGWLCMDDPDKPADMFSDQKRKRKHEIFSDTVKSRLAIENDNYSTPILMIQQRLHVDDMTAFLLSPASGLKFDCIKIPALINQEYIDSLPDWIREDCIKDLKGTPQTDDGYWSFWPEVRSLQKLLDKKHSNEYVWLSQYMQEPIALGGNMFKSDGFKFYADFDNMSDEEISENISRGIRSQPEFEFRFTTADTAQKVGKHNDYTVFCEWGCYKGNLFLISMDRGKMEAPELRKRFKQFIDKCWAKNSGKWGNLRTILVEDKSSGTGLIQELKSSLPLPITALQRNIDKVTRANDTTPQIALGKVYLPQDENWITDFVSEHSLFTADDSHKHDDMVDNTMDAVAHYLLKPKSSAMDMMFRTRN